MYTDLELVIEGCRYDWDMEVYTRVGNLFSVAHDLYDATDIILSYLDTLEYDDAVIVNGDLEFNQTYYWDYDTVLSALQKEFGY